MFITKQALQRGDVSAVHLDLGVKVLLIKYWDTILV